MNLPPLPIVSYQAWVCSKCRRLFIWEKDALVQPVIRHGFECKGDNLSQIARNQIGAANRE